MFLAINQMTDIFARASLLLLFHLSALMCFKRCVWVSVCVWDFSACACLDLCLLLFLEEYKELAVGVKAQPL